MGGRSKSRSKVERRFSSSISRKNMDRQTPKSAIPADERLTGVEFSPTITSFSPLGCSFSSAVSVQVNTRNAITSITTTPQKAQSRKDTIDLKPSGLRTRPSCTQPELATSTQTTLCAELRSLYRDLHTPTLPLYLPKRPHHRHSTSTGCSS